MVKARKQINKPVGPQKSDKKTQQNYNIWYNKVSGERHKPGEERTRATTRCNIATDAGETRGSHIEIAGICLNFARGCCPLGHECSWLHVLPVKDKFSKDVMKDCFGRERHESVRDDQSGVGSFTVDDETSRTLYVGGIVRTPGMHSVVYKHFKEWGLIDNVRVLDNKGVAFVRYNDRSNAEFAMEAMQRQSLDNNEVLNIRWATKDPNPWVEKRKEMNAKRKLADVAQDATNVDHDVTNPPSMKKDRLTSTEVTGYYPNTDYLYQDTYHNVALAPPPSPPKTLSDLVAWSQKQASVEQSETPNTNVNTQQTVTTLVGDYGSSSDED